MPPTGPDTRPLLPPVVGRLLFAAAWLAFAVVAARCAWMSDDAFITLRHLENLCEGHGLRYNVAERVQAFTHPLWALVLLPGHLLTRDPYYPPLFLSLVLGTAAVGLAAWRATPSWGAGAAALVMWTGSKGLIDFTTSGLENPLTHLLLAAFAVELLRDARVAVLAGLTGLLMTNRLDTVLLVAPALAWALAKERRPAALLWALPPLVVWHGFAFVYYGFPFPNTAYAKLGNGIPRLELLRSGGYWFDWILRTDPTTLLLCGAGTLAALRSRVLTALAAGPVLYVVYVVWIGGDFMGDRFLSAPVLLLVLPLAHLPSRAAGIAATMGLLTSLLSPWSPWRSGADYVKAPARNGIVDERGFYWHGAGWLSTAPGSRPVHRFARTGERIGDAGKDHVMKATAGFVGYYAGPDTHIVDPLGLTDPLLARLPARFDPDWRVGHFRRHVPSGYVSTAGTDEVVLGQEDTQALYDALSNVTRGPLFTTERWAAIWALNTGQRTVDPNPHRYPFLREVEELPRRTRPSGLMSPVTGDTLTLVLEAPASRIEPGLQPWTVRVDDGRTPLKTWSLPAGSHTLPLPSGSRRVLVFARKPAEWVSCSGCTL